MEAMVLIHWHSLTEWNKSDWTQQSMKADHNIPIVPSALESAKGRHENSLPLTTNFSQNVTEPYEGISYPVGDLCRRFTKQTGPCALTLHGNPIAPTDVTNVLL